MGKESRRFTSITEEMLMRLHSTLRSAVAVACAVTLGAAPLLVHTTATAKTAEAGETAKAAIQSITIKVAKKTINVRGARGLDAGRVKVKVKGAGPAEIVMFDRGYGMDDLMKAIAAVEKGNVKPLKRAIA